MKRILPFILAIVMLFVFTGCTQTDTGVSFVRVKPWQASEHYGSREILTYSVKRLYNPGTTVEKLIGEGDISFDLVVDSSGKTTLKMDYELKYTAAAQEEYRDKIDKIDSEVLFNTASLRPIRSEKRVELASIVGKEDLSYSTQTDFATLQSTIDYKNTPADGEREIKDGEYFDNEQLFYIIRALSDLTTGAQITFNSFNAYEMFLGEKFSLVPMKVSVSPSLKNVSVDQNIYTIAQPHEGENSGKSEAGGEFFIECLEATLSINAKKSGPAITLYYSNLPFNSELTPAYKSSKVLTKAVYQEYSGTTLIYSEEYTIKGHKLS